MTGVILASASPARRALLAGAGLQVEAMAAAVDEDAVKQAMRADGAEIHDVAETLAEMKARRIARNRPDALVIGADQMLVSEDTWFDKPTDRGTAADQLRRLRGKRHELVVSAVIVQGDTRLWHATDRARLTMRPFSETFLEHYLDAVGEAACTSVGGYQLEGRGAQLFTRIEGDYFTILGLPLLPLLDYLRGRGALET
ncbi:MAG: Maf family nucleotide pyrophosphatase [Azospirillaceae bacterium]